MRVDILPPEQAALVTGRPHALVVHPAPQVHGVAIQRLADRDRKLRYIEADLLRGLDDPDAGVRAAAAGAVSTTRATSQRIKRRLLEMTSSPQEEDSARWVAELNLQHFDLDAREHRIYSRAKQARSKKEASKHPVPE